VIAASIEPPAGTTAVFDSGEGRLVWTVGTVPPETTLTLSYRVRIDDGAVGVRIRNQVTATGDVPPDDCRPDGGGDSSHTAPCSTHHRTPRGPTVDKRLDGPPQFDTRRSVWTVRYRIVVSNHDPAGAAPYTLRDRLGFPAAFEIRSAGVTSSPDGVELASPAWDGVTNTVIARDASIPAASTHTYGVSVRVVVPPATPADELGCATEPGAGRTGFFNRVRLRSRGADVVDTACAAARVVLEVDKRWVIDGREHAEGSQPSGFDAELTLDGDDRLWDTRYAGYRAGASVEIGERVTVPASCTNTASGLGAVELTSASTTRTVTNVVTCRPPRPPVANTGFGMLPMVPWAGLVLAAGAALTLAARRRPRPV
jgi:hypothetical protein